EGLVVPAGLRHRLDTSGVSAEELAEAGEIDATLTAGAGPRRKRDVEGGPPALVPAFPDPSSAQADYYRKTGIYPIQHLVVMREELAQEPGIVAGVCEAFRQAKEFAEAREAASADDTPRARENRELAALMGDAWPYGIAANRRTLDAFAEASFAQGLTGRRYAVEELFAPTLPDTMR